MQRYLEFTCVAVGLSWWHKLEDAHPTTPVQLVWDPTHTQTHTQREACETSIPNFGCGWGPRTTSAVGPLLRYQTAPAAKPTKTAR